MMPTASAPDPDTTLLQHAHHELKAAALGSKQCIGGQPDIIEE